MQKENSIVLFNQKQVRRYWDEDKELWYFSVVDVVSILTESVNPQAYWRKFKERLKKEGNETVTVCHGLKMQAGDGKMRLTDVAGTARKEIESQTGDSIVSPGNATNLRLENKKK